MWFECGYNGPRYQATIRMAREEAVRAPEGTAWNVSHDDEAQDARAVVLVTRLEPGTPPDWPTGRILIR